MDDKLVIDKKGYVTFYAAAEYNGKLYISDRDNRGLLEYDLETKETVIKNIFMAENYMNNYGQAFTYKNEIWFIPLRDNGKIAIYNVRNNKLEYLDIPKSENKCDYIPFTDYVIKDDYAFMMPAHYDCLLKINLKERTFFRVDIGVQEYSGDGYPITTASILKDDKIYICPFNNNKFIIYNTKTDDIEKTIELKDKSAYTNLFSYKGKIYLVPLKISKGLTLLDVNNEKEIKKEIKSDSVNIDFECLGSIVDGTQIMFFPNKGEYIVKYNYINENVDYIRFEHENKPKELCFNRMRMVGNGKCIVRADNCKTPCLLCSNGKIEIINIKLPSDYFIKEILMEIEAREHDISNSFGIKCGKISG